MSSDLGAVREKKESPPRGDPLVGRYMMLVYTRKSRVTKPEAFLYPFPETFAFRLDSAPPRLRQCLEENACRGKFSYDGVSFGDGFGDTDGLLFREELPADAVPLSPSGHEDDSEISTRLQDEEEEDAQLAFEWLCAMATEDNLMEMPFAGEIFVRVAMANP